MKVFVTGDWHLGVTQYGVIQDDGRNSRLADAEDIIHRMIDFASGYGCKLFVCCGDVFHTNHPHPEEQIAFWRILNHLEKSDIPWSRFIIGNHDYQSKLGGNHGLKLFKEILESNPQSNIRIYDKTEWEIFYPLDDVQRFPICFYPYKGEQPIWTDMAKFGSVQGTAVVCHSHLEGAVVGAEPFEIKDDAVTRFSQLPVDHVWAGHFHKPQLLCHSPLSFYPGSPYPVDFNERLDVKGGVVVDTETRTLKTAGFKSRRLYQIDVEGSKTIPESKLTDDISGSIVKVNFTIDESEAVGFDESEIRKKLIEVGAHSIASINVKINREEVLRDPAIKLDSDLKGNFERFVSGKNYGKHVAVILDRGNQIIEKCEL